MNNNAVNLQLWLIFSSVMAVRVVIAKNTLSVTTSHGVSSSINTLQPTDKYRLPVTHSSLKSKNSIFDFCQEEVSMMEMDTSMGQVEV